MTFPLPPREAALLAEFIRVFDARLVTEGAEPRPGVAQWVERRNSSWNASRTEAEIASSSLVPGSSSLPGPGAPSVTEPLFPNEERAA